MGMYIREQAFVMRGAEEVSGVHVDGTNIIDLLLGAAVLAQPLALNGAEEKYSQRVSVKETCWGGGGGRGGASFCPENRWLN